MPLFFPSLELSYDPEEGTDEAEAVSEEQITGILKDARASAEVTDLRRRHGMSSAN